MMAAKDEKSKDVIVIIRGLGHIKVNSASHEVVVKTIKEG